ncbi:hypothetical protein HOU03_gp343 [Caulobacter phage CcrSC]|mgnify:CR=1 FL=1|uniref:Uncharacterized protein n=1 Tax=Caulobacter phage CcrSC TaxID=2283272 RepID=A0A385EFT9_9CAUD|nr:hypothetical protein HOU03_gp343 [Caulobacter phage CcrSC]AXQ69925.1 hypothetical protein CcrSC_gp343 [Caulobacter phage CcrSC]
MTYESKLNPPGFVTEEGGFRDYLHVWIKGDADTELALGVSLGTDEADEPPCLREAIAVISAFAAGVIMKQPGFASMNEEQREYAVQGGVSQLLMAAIQSAAPTFSPHPHLLPPPEPIEDDPDAVQAVGIWATPGAEGGFYAAFVDHPDTMPVGAILAAAALEAAAEGSDEDAYDTALVRAVQADFNKTIDTALMVGTVQ